MGLGVLVMDGGTATRLGREHRGSGVLQGNAGDRKEGSSCNTEADNLYEYCKSF